MWGFFHSTLLTTPWTFTGFVLSYSAENAWCARSGALRNNTSTRETNMIVFRVTKTSLNQLQDFQFSLLALLTGKISLPFAIIGLPRSTTPTGVPAFAGWTDNV